MIAGIMNITAFDHNIRSAFQHDSGGIIDRPEPPFCIRFVKIIFPVTIEPLSSKRPPAGNIAVDDPDMVGVDDLQRIVPSAFQREIFQDEFLGKDGKNVELMFEDED